MHVTLNLKSVKERDEGEGDQKEGEGEARFVRRLRKLVRAVGDGNHFLRAPEGAHKQKGCGRGEGS